MGSKSMMPGDIVLSISQGDIATAKAYLDFEDKDGRSPIFYSISFSNTNMLTKLLDAGADKNLRDKNGWTSLHHAVQKYNLAAIQVLLENGADPEIKDVYGNTSLWRAVFTSEGRGEAIALLLKFGANVNTKNHSGISPLDLASSIANYDVTHFLGIDKTNTSPNDSSNV
jgi:ankyrin repeat protein